jgi:hypothetical protein
MAVSKAVSKKDGIKLTTKANWPEFEEEAAPAPGFGGIA